MNDTIGVILAGGRATRMGRDKALVTFRGKPMITHVADSLRGAGLEVLVVGRSDSIAGLATIPDAGESGQGPMAGMVTALHAAEGHAVFLAAVDQPLLRPETVSAIVNSPGDAVVPIAGGHPQVTCAVYRPPCLAPAQAALAAGEMKLRRMLDKVAATYVTEETWSAWGEDGRSWLSLDTPAALANAEELRGFRDRI